MTPPRFLADDMLARLARWLRGAGIDAAYAGRGEEDDAILRAARAGGRVVLTRDLRFPGGPRERLVVESTDLDEQLVEVFRRYPGFDPLERPFSRCMECNGEVRAEEDPGDRPPGTDGPFTRCADCGRLFWEGTHVERIRARLARASRRAREELEEEARGEPPPIGRSEYDSFLKEILPLLGLSWRAYRRVRLGQRTRLRRRMREAGFRTLDAYAARLRSDPAERHALRAALNVTVSRFFRDRGLWLRLPEILFPELVRLAAAGPVRAWSLGCASGEEPFTLRMVWLDSPSRATPLDLLASDISEACLRRAARAVYPESAVHNAPESYLARRFSRDGAEWRLVRDIADSVRFETFDWGSEAWPGPFHLVLARNGIFTYPDEAGRRRAIGKVRGALVPGGYLWIGGNETLPLSDVKWEVAAPGLFRAAQPRASKDA
ncbi:MAG: hypothetical protein EHM19_01150 [Candidatus Latescibacterota bacterium]|nr:MAG: hypothetical protein EHM19_01150 [Candidatus Latescibacterota bacterium]